ncbi:hypothetical protein [Alkalibacillus almallahensis]|uniref:hypothetical protein n=1 Tax=Alkalibacillus almallahensis TaxID=1379154 RepID=UPI001422B3F9|nr:hypothetical protein [Alkalibacillus almallahensis]NIK12848.1 crossover junction endodeoxyribonuclease RuvC [Alkalibacillus almallahensis]
MRYIGLDPSTKTGFVVMDEQGEVLDMKEIKPKSKQDPERFGELAELVGMEIEQGDKVIIEGFSYGSKGAAVSTQYGIGWLLRSKLVELSNLDVIDRYVEVTPSGLKKFATGKGNTKKEDMILPIFKRWGFEHDSDNVRDAFVLAQIGRYLDGHKEPTSFQQDVLSKLQANEVAS